MSSRSISPTVLRNDALDPGQALLLDIIGQVPVQFHRAYVGVAGSINAALWLSFAMSRRAQLIDHQREAGIKPGGTFWFGFSREDCETGTGLTRHQQNAARKELRVLGIVLEQRRSTTEVAIDCQRLGALLLEQSITSWNIALQATQEPGELRHYTIDSSHTGCSITSVGHTVFQAST